MNTTLSNYMVQRSEGNHWVYFGQYDQWTAEQVAEDQYKNFGYQTRVLNVLTAEVLNTYAHAH